MTHVATGIFIPIETRSGRTVFIRLYEDRTELWSSARATLPERHGEFICPLDDIEGIIELATALRAQIDTSST